LSNKDRDVERDLHGLEQAVQILARAIDRQEALLREQRDLLLEIAALLRPPQTYLQPVSIMVAVQ
jgi:hypothetical protein